MACGAVTAVAAFAAGGIDSAVIDSDCTIREASGAYSAVAAVASAAVTAIAGCAADGIHGSALYDDIASDGCDTATAVAAVAAIGAFHTIDNECAGANDGEGLAIGNGETLAT